MDRPPLAEAMAGIQIAAAACAMLGITTCLLAVMLPIRLRVIVFVSGALTWISYGFYEHIIPQGLRYDLIFFVPLMIAVTAAGVVVFVVSRSQS
jgi:hypothetical protein